eukprot:118915_1
MSELCFGKASVYAHDDSTKQWITHGTSGRLYLQLNNENANGIRIKWSKNEQQIWWCLINSKLKKKGERAWIFKARQIQTNTIEILAVRFSKENDAKQFAQKCKSLFLETAQNPNIIQHVQQPSSMYMQAHMNQIILPPNQNNQINTHQWKCAVCTYTNDMNITLCEMCGLSRDSSIKSNVTVAASNTNIWNCALCTYTNTATSMSCNVCGIKKNDTNNQQQAASNKISNHWICTVCTMQNDTNAVNCATCNNPIFAMQNMTMSMGTIPSNYKPPSIRIQISYDKNGCIATSMEQFQKVATQIAVYNDSPCNVFSTLRSVTKKLSKDDVRYRTLDTTGPKVMERLIGYEGVLDFLILLGFESDVMGMKLICDKRPDTYVIIHAVKILNRYQLKFGIGSYFVNQGNMRNQGKLNQTMLEHDELLVFGYIRQYNILTKDIPNVLINVFISFYHENILQIKKIEQYGDNNLSLDQIINWSSGLDDVDNDMMKALIITTVLNINGEDTIRLMKYLRKHFIVSTTKYISLNMKIMQALKYWIEYHWKHDLLDNELLKNELELWLKEISNHKYKNHRLTDIIDSISTQFKILKFKRNVMHNEESMEDYFDVNRKKRDELLVFGYIHSLLSIPIDIMHLFVQFYHSPIKIPKFPNNCKLSRYTPDEIADQITLLSNTIFCNVKESECIGQRWRKKNKSTLSPNILRMIEHFNAFMIYIQIQILTAKSLKARSYTIKNIIKMGQRFWDFGNYNALYGVLGALRSSSIHRLKLAWKHVSKKQIEIFEQFKKLFSYDRNQRTLIMNSCDAMIPPFGFLLQDFVFIDDGSDHRLNDGSQLFRNLMKSMRTLELINQMKGHQILAKSYNDKIKENTIIQKLLLLEFDKIKDIDEEQIWNMSTETKKRDERLVGGF